MTKLDTCPNCGKPFEHFHIAGGVYRSGFRAWIRSTFLGWPVQFCLICRACKEIVGYEPSDDECRLNPTRKDRER